MSTTPCGNAPNWKQHCPKGVQFAADSKSHQGYKWQLTPFKPVRFWRGKTVGSEWTWQSERSPVTPVWFSLLNKNQSSDIVLLWPWNQCDNIAKRNTIRTILENFLDQLCYITNLFCTVICAMNQLEGSPNPAKIIKCWALSGFL